MKTGFLQCLPKVFYPTTNTSIYGFKWEVEEK